MGQPGLPANAKRVESGKICQQMVIDCGEITPPLPCGTYLAKTAEHRAASAGRSRAGRTLVTKRAPPHKPFEKLPSARLRNIFQRLACYLPLKAGLKENMRTAVRSRCGHLFDTAADPLADAPATARSVVDHRKGRVVEKLDFQCNVCGTLVEQCPVEKIDREVSSCNACGSSVRMRSIVHLLSLALHGKSMAIPEWPSNLDIRGVGLSDWTGYATRLPRKVNYLNTYFHMEPFLDICNPPEEYSNVFDFLISTEVYEHVPPPASRAFEASYKILKPGGAFVFTVPYTHQPDTLEHFPDLHRFEIVKMDNDFVMVNRRKDGTFELHTKLAFHGGPGTTLEMRVYSRASIMRHLEQAGFMDITIMDEPYLEMGIIHTYPWSLPILARKPP